MLWVKPEVANMATPMRRPPTCKVNINFEATDVTFNFISCKYAMV